MHCLTQLQHAKETTTVFVLCHFFGINSLSLSFFLSLSLYLYLSFCLLRNNLAMYTFISQRTIFLFFKMAFLVCMNTKANANKPKGKKKKKKKEKEAN
ncbi:hypothetical protein BKA57DRAFT_277952 [Linnemannia elongata]|nr:hypothetical protein BKA57DRAFT_277952 [Linnemannia elongata]